MFTLSLSSPAVTFENSGGKGANLGKLVRLGLPVPPGFILTTEAYRGYLQVNGLEKVIAAAVEGMVPEAVDALERASRTIRAAFSAGRMPEEIDQELLRAYLDLGSPSLPAAVRSSATTEDLPDLSFAGQQDTFLNVIGEAALRKAVVDCWSSLWTARAIGYRRRNAIADDQATVAVVVQELIHSDTSGVLFTANPLSGLLSESVIDATFGLGEALVSGQVEPDHIVVDSLSREIRSFTIGRKAVFLRSAAAGGVETVQTASTEPSLTQAQLLELTETGQKIQAGFGGPQDIEWAYAGGRLFILQARPITSLFPVPRVSFDPLILWFSFGAFQGVAGPITPLGQESIRRVALGVAERLRLSIPLERLEAFVVSGERMWIKVSDLLRNPLGNRLLRGLLTIGEPGSVLTLRQLAADPRLGAGRGRMRASTLLRIVRFIFPAILEMPRVVLRPEKARQRFDAQMEAYLRSVRIPGGSDRFERLANFAAFMNGQGGLAEALPYVLPRFMPVMATSLISLNMIGHLLPVGEASQGGPMMLALDVTRGLPRNVTTEMDLALWEAARAIQSDPESLELIRQASSAALAQACRAGRLPAAFQSAVQGFLDRYGMRGVGEIDMGQPRWREDPAPILETLQSYVQIPPEAAPDRLFQANAGAAEAAIERMAARVRPTRGGWIKARLLRAAARRVRLLLGTRESPKFYAIRVMDIVRSRLLAIGEEFAAPGTIRQPEDLFFLHVDELAALAQKDERDWPGLIDSRRQTYERESRRRQVPRLLASDGRAFYEGVGAQTDTGETITGSPVSPGQVEGRVRVVRDPRRAGLQPGEIMVCPGTDPAWTPLFMAAGGLVMEVGGMMTHGSVVAREYGIPAVVGVDHATTRLKDGQRIRLDGSSGRITVLE